MQTDGFKLDSAAGAGVEAAVEAGVEDWEAAVAADPGCDAFAALAEWHRRAGSSLEARRIAEAGLEIHPHHPAGRVALGLALMDLGNLDDARSVLSELLPSAPPEPVELAPLDRLDDNARPLQTPVECDLLEPVSTASPLGAPGDAEIEQAFANAESDPSEMMDANRVAEYVLEQEMDDLSFQGDTHHENFDELSGVEVRDGGLVEPRQAREPIDDAKGVRILASLESWLQNIRRPVV